mmetsp:Transcript_13888/g.37802  ORF Transcript_13888/g.37802 Transcript_13888/m.37802 type:complete len:500 (+) Transcript_13888:74-1573(+)
MVAKRKAATSTSKLFGQASKHREEAQLETKALMKKPAAAAAAEDDHHEDAAMEAEEEEDAATVEQNMQQLEEEEAAKRQKELKAMPASDVKELVTSRGLEARNKAEMIEVLLAHEAKERADKREHEAKLRAVVVKKKEELEAQSISELAKLCGAICVKGIMSKQERVERLLKQWQEDDGVDKALVQMAYDTRKQALEAMDKTTLQGLCEKAGIDPFVAEAMVDRIGAREHEMGCYLRPVLANKEAQGDENVDMVSAILANEQTRKKEKDLKGKQEEAVANRKKEMRAMSVEELKKTLESKGATPAGKKDDMVEALFKIATQEDAIVARKSELKALSLQELKDLCAGKKLEVGSKNDMVEALLAEEARLREALRAFDAKAQEALAQKKDEFEAKTNAELKDLCASKGLKLGAGKEERVERLVEECRRDGEVDKAVSVIVRKERREALSKMNKEDLLQLCDKIGADPLVKELMVERILAHESEIGEEVAEPAKKKARASKK